MANKKVSIYKGDNTGAFSEGSFLKINVNGIPEGFEVSKAEIKIGILPVIEVENPVFPLGINLTSEQTSVLMNKNNIYVALYDSEGRKKTCKGTKTFDALEQVV